MQILLNTAQCGTNIQLFVEVEDGSQHQSTFGQETKKLFWFQLNLLYFFHQMYSKSQ